MLRFKTPEFCFYPDPLNIRAVFFDHSYLETHGIYRKGGGVGDSVDTAYNARMASIYENQNAWANKYNQFWETYERPYEIAKINANMQMLEGDTALAMEKTQAERDLLPSTTALGIAQNESALELLPMQTQYEQAALTTGIERQEALRPVQEQFFTEALDGVDANDWAANAQADAARAFMSSQTATEMALARRGATPGSGAYSGKKNEEIFARTSALGMAATSGRESAERESFNRLTTAMSMGGS